MSIESTDTFDNVDLPQWYIDMLDARLAEYHNNPNTLLDWDEVSKSLPH